MKKIVFFMALIAVAVMAAPLTASAMSLKAKQVENFIASMGPVNALAEETGFQTDLDFMAADEFAPFALGLKSIKNSEEEAYKKLGRIVRDHGFTTQEDWAATGDAVMLAFIAVKAEADNPGFADQMALFTPEMMANMPPEAKVQIETTLKMIKAVQAVPAENKTIVTPYLPQIEHAISGGTPQ